MFDHSNASAGMADAEARIRAALSMGSPAERCDRLMDLYWATPAEGRDALVAVLVARLTLVAPARAA